MGHFLGARSVPPRPGPNRVGKPAHADSALMIGDEVAAQPDNPLCTASESLTRRPALVADGVRGPASRHRVGGRCAGASRHQMRAGSTHAHGDGLRTTVVMLRQFIVYAKPVLGNAFTGVFKAKPETWKHCILRNLLLRFGRRTHIFGPLLEPRSGPQLARHGRD